MGRNVVHRIFSMAMVKMCVGGDVVHVVFTDKDIFLEYLILLFYISFMSNDWTKS